MVKPDIADEIPILIGEVLYNFRAALDYSVGQISRLQTPDWTGRPRRNQFPIESTAEGYRGRRNSFLAGVGDGVVRFIEGIQPYNNCDWTRRLGELSNLDKHNELIVVFQAFGIRFDDSAAKQPPPTDGTKPLIVADVETMLRIKHGNARKRGLLDELGEIEFHVDRTLALFDVELFNPKPTKYPGLRFPGEF